MVTNQRFLAQNRLTEVMGKCRPASRLTRHLLRGFLRGQPGLHGGTPHQQLAPDLDHRQGPLPQQAFHKNEEKGRAVGGAEIGRVRTLLGRGHLAQAQFVKDPSGLLVTEVVDPGSLMLRQQPQGVMSHGDSFLSFSPDRNDAQGKGRATVSSHAKGRRGECRVIAFEPCRGCTSSSRSRTLESELKAQVEIKGPERTGAQWAVDSVNRLNEAQQTGFRPIIIGENGGSGHQDIGSSAHGQRGRLQVDAAIDFQLTVGVALLQ